MTFYYYFKWPLWSIKIGRHFFKIKPTKNELFSERHGYWNAKRIWGISFLHKRMDQ